MENALCECFQAFAHHVAAWHTNEPEVPETPDAETAFLHQALTVHLSNFKLWHLEDEARRDDMGPEHVARCKRAIDAMNQRRNDGIERLDARLESLIASFLPPETPCRYNTETMGSGLDRLSILYLKMYHMQAETERQDALPEHIARCRDKHALLIRQRDDLQRSLLELLGDYACGLKRPMIYRQFKMYNDPSTNPALYGQGQKSDQ